MAPQPEHPKTTAPLAEQDIHANQMEAFNAALRRRMACYRRKTNTYAKNDRLQCCLDVYWLLHNLVCTHFTTKQVPAVAWGIVAEGLSVAELFRLRCV